MSTVKISQLYEITQLNEDTDNTLLVGVDVPNQLTGKLTCTTLASGLYHNNPLNVGPNEILFPYTQGQFSGTSPLYLQVNLQNFTDTGSGDYIVTGDKGTDTTSYIDLGFTNSNYSNTSPINGLGTAIEPLSGYLYVQGNTSGGNLIVGTATKGTEVKIIVGGVNSENVIYTITSSGIKLKNNSFITFKDDTIQTTAAAPNNYSYSSYAFANTVNAYAYNANTWLQANDAATLSSSKSYTDSANSFLRSNDSITLASAKTYANEANTFLQSNDSLTLSTSRTYTNVANNWLQANDSITLTSAISYTNSITTSSNNWLQSNVGSALANAKVYTDTANTFIQSNYLANTNNIVTRNNLTVSGAFYAANTIRTSEIYPSTQTAITISFSNSALVKCNTSLGLNITPTNFVPGKFIDVIVVNSSGSTQSINPGVAGNNTKGVSSFNVPGGTVTYLRYFSMGTDIANTYCSVVNG